LQPELVPKTTLPLVVIDDRVQARRTLAGVRRLRRIWGAAADYTILLEGTNDVEDGHTDDTRSATYSR
jgi:hypothetical protein